MRCSTLKSAVVAAVMGLSFASSSFAGVRNPVGEAANYEVERSSSRTSSMILSGTVDTKVLSANPNHADGPAYNVELEYVFRVQMFGNQSGVKLVEVPAEYFSPEFMQDLRANGEYVSPSFKVRHLGYADVRNMDGRTYTRCDKVLIYDVDAAVNEALITLARKLVVPTSEPIGPEGDIENLQIVAHIKAGVPVLGAVKLDVSGTYQGQRLKAGADYKAP